MRHGKRNIKFGRHPAHRRATVNSLLSALVRYNRIETTLAKAKEVRRHADRLITLAKKGAVHHRRLAYRILKDRDLVSILFKDLGPLFGKRAGGYTRVIHTRVRVGDGAQLAILEWTEKKEVEIDAKSKVKSKKEKVKAEEHKPEVKAEPKKEPEKYIEKVTPVEEKTKDHLKHEVKRPEVPHPSEGHKQKKGFLGGLRKLFGDRRRGEK